jgi:hypothetical protein
MNPYRDDRVTNEGKRVPMQLPQSGGAKAA